MTPVVTKKGSYTGPDCWCNFARANYKKGTVYSWRPDFETISPNVAEKDDPSSPPPPAAPVEEPVVEVAQMGSGTTTKKRRRGSGRRTAFGTRQSLVNLRNV